MKVNIIFDDHDEEFDDVKQYSNINNDKKYLSLVMNTEQKIVYIKKERIERIEIFKNKNQKEDKVA